jgi:hypothetical protein
VHKAQPNAPLPVDIEQKILGYLLPNKLPIIARLNKKYNSMHQQDVRFCYEIFNIFSKETSDSTSDTITIANAKLGSLHLIFDWDVPISVRNNYTPGVPRSDVVNFMDALSSS